MFSILCAADRRDLSPLLFGKIKEDLDLGKQVVLVVPAQSSLSLEKEALKVLGTEGFFNLHIIRGQKLAETIQSETRRLDKTPINTIGRSMLLRSIAAKNKDKLGSFKDIAEDPEFLSLAGDFIVQLKQNAENESTIDKLIDSAKSPILKGKLSDMKILLSEYELLMQGKLTDSEDLVLHTAAMAKDSKFVKNSAIYYYGFYSFTSRELELLDSLEKASLGLNIALLLGSEEHFQITKKTLAKLQKKMPNAQIISAQPKEAPLCALPTEKVNIVCCAGPYSQALTIAADIKKNIREKNLSYSDIAVLTGANTEITSSLKRVFKEAGIPVFIDEKRTVLHSGGIEAVTSALNLAINNYKAKDAIRFLKSGVLGFAQNDIELFENYVKLYHIKQDKFAKDFKYGEKSYGEASFAMLNNMRKAFYKSTSLFVDAFNKAETVKDKSLALYNYFAGSINLPQILSNQAKAQEEAGLVDAAEETKQVWGSLCSLLDQMTELLGSELISGKDYAEMLNNSLSDIKVGVLPQAEGKVAIGSISRSQIEEVKILYIAGVNDNVIPSANDPNGILTQAEIAGIEELGINLSKNADFLCEEENYCIYKALSAATEKLWLGYCTSDANGSDMKPSSLISDFKKLYPSIEIQNDILNNNDDLAFIEGKTMTLQKLSEEIRSSMENAQLSPIWKDSYNILKDDALTLKEGLRFSNKKKALGIELARDLFTKSENTYSLSPSRMDNFASCPFKHFISYGLRPSEEDEFGVNAGTIGDMHHEALLRLCNILSQKSIEEGFAITDERSLWMTVSDEEIEQILTEILNDIQKSIDDGVMISSKENEYAARRTIKTCLKFAKHMVEQVRHSVIDEMFFEADFRRGRNFPAIEIDTSAGKVFVEGRIDRVDVCPKGDGKYIRVIDYKSGQTEFKKALVEKGLQLQLMIYLESAMNKYPDANDGGVYYFHIKDNSVGATIEDFPKDEIAEEVLDKINKVYKLDGMDVDPEFKAQFSSNLTDLCTSLTEGYINATPKKIKSSFDSCLYCTYSSICHKDIM
ncbi:MAG: PD-(D/E)XK nuclease family protein [Clostridia bacterium]|nr:PD-(D/E)XK nuclease family protein [Clostridia bacterium]